MASVSFDGTTTTIGGGLTYITPPFTMVVDCIPLTLNTGVLISQLRTASNFYGHYLDLSAGATARVVSADNNTFATASCPGVVAGMRQVFTGIWKTTSSRQCFVNLQPGAIDTTLKSPSLAPDNTRLGSATHNSVSDNFAKMLFFRAAVWNVALDIADIAQIMRLSNTMDNIGSIRPASLVEAWNVYNIKGFTGQRQQVNLNQQAGVKYSPQEVIRPQLYKQRVRILNSVSGSVFRSTLSRLGSRTGSRQVHRV